MFEYQKSNRFFAQVTGMMEGICEQELIELGAVNTEKAYRGVYFEADIVTLYRIKLYIKITVACPSTTNNFLL